MRSSVATVLGRVFAKSAADRIKFEPGLYNLSRRIRDTNGFLNVPTNFGTHRYVLGIPEKPEDFPEAIELENGQRGVVLGSYNRPGPENGPARILQADINEAKDLASLNEFTDVFRAGSPEWDTTLKRVPLRKRTDKRLRQLIQRLRNYQRNTAEAPVEYPDALTNAAGQGRNSNTFVRTLMRVAKLRADKLDNPTPGDQLRLSPELFT